MSTIGSATAAGFNLAGSVAGSPRTEASDRYRAAAADQKSQVDRERFSQSLSDVGNAEFGSERDADGRQIYRRAERRKTGDAEAAVSAESPGPLPSTADAFGERGNTLDLEA
jgi:hypothetical protein